MEFGVIGINFKTASLSRREKSTFRDSDCLSFYNHVLSWGITQVVVVSTCNRSEVYFIYEDIMQLEQMKLAYQRYTVEDNVPYMFSLLGLQAMEYLFEVCGGFQSALVGEDQILHQMKQAYQLSAKSGACNKEMHKIWQTCFASIKAFKHQWMHHRYSVSLPYLVIQRLKDFTLLKDKTMMIIGSGEMAELLRTYAQQECLHQLYLCNRTYAHVSHVLGCEIVPFSRRYEAISHCDIVCSATASPHTIIEKMQLYPTQKQQIFIDLALPRDIDEAIHKDAVLWNMDDFEGCIDEHRMQREQDMRKGHASLRKDAKKIYDWFLYHHVDAAMQTLTKRSDESARQTYELLRKKLTLSPHEDAMVRHVVHASFHRLVKEARVQLKNVKVEDQQAYITMLETLFQGEDDE